MNACCRSPVFLCIGPLPPQYRMSPKEEKSARKERNHKDIRPIEDGISFWIAGIGMGIESDESLMYG